jgi:enamine deaminase RidA (YjgF/YER057c/UK114 family)
MSKKIIATDQAPAAIGTYSQAVQVGNTVYMSGQIGLDPTAMTLVDGIDAQIVQVFENLKAVAAAAGASLNDAVKFNIYLTDLANRLKSPPHPAARKPEPPPTRGLPPALRRTARQAPPLPNKRPPNDFPLPPFPGLPPCWPKSWTAWASSAMKTWPCTCLCVTRTKHASHR